VDVVPAPALVPGQTVRIRDERWVVTRRIPGADASVIEVRGRDRSNRDARAAFLLPFEIVEPLASDRSVRRVSAGRWKRLIRALLCEATPSWQSLRTPLRARISLLPFQLEPALAVTHGMAARILIADEVGLGKTIQAALIIAEILERTPHVRVLVVAPASLIEQWQTELHERFSIDAWHADSASVARAGACWGAANPWAGRPVTITSIDFVKRPEVIRSLEAIVWDGVVFDEAHGLVGRSDRALAAAALAQRARTVVLLTATPHSGDDRAFDSLRGIGDLDGRFPLLTFRRTRADLGIAVSRKTSFLRVALTVHEREMHRALQTYARRVRTERGPGTDPAHLVMAVLTRRACSSAWSLARSIERRMALLAGEGSPTMTQLSLPLVDLAADEEPGAELSARGLDDLDEERRWLDRILTLARRAESAESKLRALMRTLRRAREPAIVFTEYRDTLVRVASALQAMRPVTVHGGLPPLERRENLRRFTGGDAPLLLATDAASEGLNLQQRCRLVINLELPWTPLRLEQRIGRVERIGQSRRVHAVHLVAAGTAEETLVARLQTRSGRAVDALQQVRDQAAVLPSLPGAAEAETARLATLRALSHDLSVGVTESRPIVTTVRTRERRDTVLWAFHCSFTDGCAGVVWRTLLGAVTSHEHPNTLRDPIDATAALVLSHLEGHRERALASLRVSLHAVLELAARRERALAGTLETERARLSAALLQRGLFDRRAERHAAAQGAVLDDALQRCRTRLAEISAASEIVAEPGQLAFVLFRR
jgi:superfamily II DNA or RNA helicase